MGEHRHFLLGLFFLVVFGGIAYYTLSHSDLTLFKYRQELTVYFPRAHGLQSGSSVQVAGVRWGRVTGVEFDPSANPNRRVVVTLDLDAPLELHDNFEILIKTATLLGGRLLSIDPGSAERPIISPDRVLDGEIAPDPIEALGDLVRKNDAAVTQTIEGLRQLVEGVTAGHGIIGRLFVNETLGDDLARGMAAAADTFQSAKIVAEGLANGEGTFGRLLREDAVYVELERIAADIKMITEDTRVIVSGARAGKGLVGRILTDEGVGNDLSDGLSDLREIIGRLNRGEGTLGRIVSGETIGANIDTLLQRLVDGEGTFGKLFSDEALYTELASIGADIAVVATHIREGRGTIGKLVMDEELYDQLRLAIGLITRSLEEFRESAPISTMTSVIFGAF